MLAMQMYGSVAGPWHTDAWSYDLAPRFAQIPSRSLPGGFTQQFSYDHVGRLLLQQHLDGGVPQVTDYTYDAASRLIEVEEPDGRTVEFWYDNDDQVVHEVRTSPLGFPTVVTRFGPVQTRLGADYVQLLPQLALQGSSMRYTLTEPDGRTPWVVNNNGSLYSEQYSTAYGLDYDTTAWGAVSTSSKWPLGGLHGAESENAGEVMHFGARHVALRGDGLWMQPEPLLAMGLPPSFRSVPRHLGPVYAGGNSLLYADVSGYATIHQDGTMSLDSQQEHDSLETAGDETSQTQEWGVLALAVVDSQGSLVEPGKVHLTRAVGSTATGEGSDTTFEVTGQTLTDVISEVAANLQLEPGQQLAVVGQLHGHYGASNANLSGGKNGDIANATVAASSSPTGKTLMGVIAGQKNGMGGRDVSIALVAPGTKYGGSWQRNVRHDKAASWIQASGGSYQKETLKDGALK